jgi:hypothetical protein
MQLELLLRDTRKSLLAERRARSRNQRLAGFGCGFDGAALCKAFSGFHMNTSVRRGV